MRKISKKSVLPFLCLPLVCFCFFPKQLNFRTKRIGTLLWVSWLFSVHVSLAIPLFKQRLLYAVYEVEPTANIITVSYSESTPAKPPFCTALAGFHVKLFPFSKDLMTVPFSTVIWVPWLRRAGLWTVLSRKKQPCSYSLPNLDWAAQLKSGALSGWAERWGFEWPSQSEERKHQWDLGPVHEAECSEIK